jgi:hypothetical protein
MRELSRLLGTLSLCLALLGAAPGCGGGGGGPVDPMPAGGRVLFVGNSLTYFNDLPEMVRGLTEAAGLPAVEVESVAFPDYDLGLHLDRGDAMRAIRSKRCTLVVLQQGPSSLEENRAQLRAWTVTFAADIRKAGARPALYMVWPSLENAWTFDRAVESYRLAADDVDGVLFPVGEAFRVARAKDPTAPLYENDGYHPTITGSYLAALVIVARLHDRSPVGLPRHFTVSGHAVDIPESLAALLQEAAAEANARFPNP